MIPHQRIERPFSLIFQAAKFGVVGLSATAVHIIGFVFWVNVGVGEHVANVLAFCAAFFVSFFGHFHWTFRTDDVGHHGLSEALPRFFATSLGGLCVNAAIVYVVVDLMNQHYALATAGMATLTPAVTFVLAKLWVYKA